MSVRMSRAVLWPLVALGMTAALSGPVLSASTDVPPVLSDDPAGATAGAPTRILGFRSARFGMIEFNVRQAIRKDLGIASDGIVRAQDDFEKTTSLQLEATDLLPMAGKAKISYVFGFKSRKLIQVNIGWGAAAGAEISTEALIDAADLLREHLLHLKFKPESVVVNRQLPDGSTVVVRGQDRQGHVVLLVLAGEKAEDKAGDKDNPSAGAADAGPSLKITTLMLSYIQDIEHPDVFHLKPGAF